MNVCSFNCEKHLLIPLRNEFGVICCLAINSKGSGEGDSSRWACIALPQSAQTAEGENGMERG